MKTYARIQDGRVAELFATDGDITSMFNPALVWVDVSSQAGHRRRLALRRNELHPAARSTANGIRPDDRRSCRHSSPHSARSSRLCPRKI